MGYAQSAFTYAQNIGSIVSTMRDLHTNMAYSQSENKYGCGLNMKCLTQPHVLGASCLEWEAMKPLENLIGLEVSHLGGPLKVTDWSWLLAILSASWSIVMGRVCTTRSCCLP